MGKTIYIQCYEGLSAKMMVEALLNLMPEQTQAKATVDQLLTLDCPAEVKAAMIRKLPRKIKDFALPEGAVELFQRAYDIWLHAKAAVQRVNIAHVEFQEKDYDEVIAMLAASICMERLEADTIICPIVYDGYGQIYIDHEPVSVPLPETLYILMGAEIAMHRMERDSAWVTPEGAAFLAACRTSDHLPEEYHVSKIGTGRGTASDGSNGVLRIMVLEDGNAEKSGMADFSEKEAVEKNIESNFPEKEEIEKNIEADFCNTGKEGLQKLKEQEYQLVVLDVMMPGMDGFETLEEIRKENSLPILMFTSKNDSISKVRGLRAGADDYLTKPFDMDELIARIASLIRRYTRFNHQAGAVQKLDFDGLQIDLENRSVTTANGTFELPPKEFDLLLYCAKHQGKILTKQQIYEEVWGEEYFYDDSNIMAIISRLRKKLEVNPSSPKYIQTVKGIGYRFNKEV